MPGVYHCANGPGADTFDPLTVMEEWVEKDIAPQTITAKNPRVGVDPQTAIKAWLEQGITPQITIARNPHMGIDRPVCAWPKLPYYSSGDPASATSFKCR